MNELFKVLIIAKSVKTDDKNRYLYTVRIGDSIVRKVRSEYVFAVDSLAPATLYEWKLWDDDEKKYTQVSLGIRLLEPKK